MKKKITRLINFLALFLVLVAVSSCGDYAQPGMQVWLDYPQNDISLSSGETITVQVHARDQSGPGIQEILFIANGVQIGAVSTNRMDPMVEVSASWQPVAGDYQLVARAVSQTGQTADSLPVRVMVTGSTIEPPQVMTPSFTPTATVTLTPPPPESNEVYIIPGQNTYCRTGPGQVYPSLAIINAGMQVRAVARYPDANYFVVLNPFASGECWLWGYAATIIGPVEILPIAVPPPPPVTETPTPTTTPTRLPTSTVTSLPPLITFYIRNDFTSYSIYDVYLAPGGTSSWGTDLLSTSIPPGGIMAFQTVEGLYNVKIGTRAGEGPGPDYYLNNQILGNNVVLVFGP